MAIYGVDWPYGVWKTSFSVYYAKKFKEKYKDKGLIISNIKLYWSSFEDYLHFDDNNIIDVLRFVNLINDYERTIEKNYFFLKNWKKEYKRGAFTKTLIIFDESGALLNKHQKQVYQTSLLQYVNQTRKMFYDLIMTSVLWDENFKQLRDKVEFWYSMEAPFGYDFPILWGIRTIYREKREKDWTTLKTEKYIWKDIKWDRVLKERPLKYKFDWFYKPLTYNNYDDLHKNINEILLQEEILSLLDRLKIPQNIQKKYWF